MTTLFSRDKLKKIGWKTHENVAVLHFLAVDNPDFTGKSVEFFGWKIRGNVAILHFFAVDNFDITRKNVEIFGWKTHENVAVLHFLALNKRKSIYFAKFKIAK